MSRNLDERFHKEKDRPRVTAGSIEIDRIVRLAIWQEPTKEELEEFCRLEIDAKHYREGFRFFPKQAGAVMAYDLVQGLFGPIGVGWGKTLITLMIAARAFRKGIARSILMIPPEVYAQLTRRDIPWARARVDLNVPFMLMGGKTRAERRAIAKSGKKGCYVMPYSLLSVEDSTDLLNWIDAGLLILDEVHKLKNRDAARTTRVTDFIRRKQPEVCDTSGTITSKSIMDYHHLIGPALKENNPLPQSEVLAMQWAMVLDAAADPSDAHMGPVTPLLTWARTHFPDVKLPPHIAGFRAAYKLRLTSAPGVVCTGDAEIGVSLMISNHAVPEPEKCEGWEKLEEKIADVTDRWISPSGDEIDYAFHQWKNLWELNSGFYYWQKWPTVEEIKSRRAMTTEEAATFLAMAQQHHLAKQAYHKLLRYWLNNHFVPGLDTPMLVGKHFATHGAGRIDPNVYEAWREAKSLEFPGMPERDSVPVRICDYKIQAALKWVKALPKKAGALVWYYHQDVGDWLAEEFYAAGINYLHCPAGEQFNIAITDPKNYDKVVIASYTAHGTGKNLQAFQHQLCVQFPRQADVAEQLIGRTHRNGQEADELVVSMMNTTEFDHQNFAACLNDALYLHQTVGARQKLVYASYDPLPRIYPSDFLRERGFQNRTLTREEQMILTEKFGPAPGT